MSVSDVALVINQLLPEPHAGLLAGILFGTKAALPYEFKQALITTGTIHITALSGMNVSIISVLVARTLLCFFSRRITSLLTIIIIIGFVQFVGGSASIVRAAIMGCLSLVATVFGRQKQALWFLGITSIVMVVVYPLYLSDVSFQLSVLATLGIILFGQSKNIKRIGMLSHIKQSLVDNLRTTLSAQIFTTPLIAVQFHRISVIAPLANLLIGWIIAPITVLGFIFCFVGVVYLPLAIPLSWFIYLLLEYTVRIVELMAQIPFASLQL